MTREERLLAILQTQTEIAGERLDADAAIALVAERALEVTGAARAEIVLPTGAVHFAGSPAMHGSATRSAPLSSRGSEAGRLVVYAAGDASFAADVDEMLSLLAGVLGAQVPAQTSAEDPLTGLGHPRAFSERLALECARVARHGGEAALVYADVDGLKRLNDLHGFQTGDGVLRTVGAVLRRWTRAVDGVHRVGGDEFTLILPGASVEAAAMLMNRIGAHLADAHPLKVTITYGVAPVVGEDPNGVLTAAEDAYRAAKLAAHREQAA